MPAAVIDGDMAAIGDPLRDLAFAVWMWVMIDGDQSGEEFAREVQKMYAMLDAFGLPVSERPRLCGLMLSRMDEVGEWGKTANAGFDVSAWTDNCKRWVGRYQKEYLQRR